MNRVRERVAKLELIREVLNKLLSEAEIAEGSPETLNVKPVTITPQESSEEAKTAAPLETQMTPVK